MDLILNDIQQGQPIETVQPQQYQAITPPLTYQQPQQASYYQQPYSPPAIQQPQQLQQQQQQQQSTYWKDPLVREPRIAHQSANVEKQDDKKSKPNKRKAATATATK